MPAFYAYSYIPAIVWPPRPPLAHRLANLLLSDRVQEIRFAFGSVVTFPEGFRAVAAALIAGRITVTTDPALVPLGADASYDKRKNIIGFCQDDVLDFANGRGFGVHEAFHAVHDIRGRNTARRTEEAAAYVASCWYLFSCMEPCPATIPTELWDIAVAIRGRAIYGSGLAHATGGEIQRCRSLIAHKYDCDHFGNDGV